MLSNFRVEKGKFSKSRFALLVKPRSRTNGFLQKINDGFFRPRGLYCLVMTWNPESTHRVEQLNIVERIDLGTKPANGLSNLPSKYRVSDGNSYGQWDFPEVAPLVFPALDQLAARMDSDGIKKKNRMAQGMTFVANYWDKRATAEYVSLATVCYTCGTPIDFPLC